MSLSLRVRALFLCSGAVALGLEAAWFRRMVPVFGASHAVGALLLAVYMAGLALGAALGAVASTRIRAPLRAYALCEAVVALSALASIPAFSRIEHSSVAASLPLAALVSALVLALPTTAMGATTPLLVRALEGRSTTRANLASLYATNLVGASIGALASGFVLLPRFGIRAVITSWATLATLVALGALALSRSATSKTHTIELPDDSQHPSPPWSWRGPAVAVVSGALSFALQVSLVRVASLLLGSTAYTFELLVSVVLVSLAAGATRSKDDESDREAWSTVSRRSLRLAVAVFLAMLVVRIAPVYVQLIVRSHGSPGPVRLLLVAALACWPYFEIGALFPTIASRIPTRVGATGVGVASASVTVGNVLGALLAGFYAIPALGVQSTLRAVSLGALALATVTAIASDRARARSAIITACVAIIVGSLIDRPWDTVALNAGTFRTAANRRLVERRDAPCGPGRSLPDTRALFTRDGSLGTVTVLGHSDGRCSLVSLRVNGKTEGSVFYEGPLARDGAASVPRTAWRMVGDLPSERFVGSALGALTSQRETQGIGRAFMVGWGTGISARALLELSPTSLVATEIEPVVIDASRLFDREIHSHPALVLVRDDARRALRATPEASLDAVVSHPSNPWVTGATGLFSREFFALVRSRLAPRGAVLAWVQLYEIDVAGVRSMVRTFVERFPNAVAVRTSPASRDLFLLGTTERRPIDRTHIQRQLDGAYGATGLRVASGEELARWSQSAPIVTDDNALLEFRVADMMLAGREDPSVLALPGLAWEPIEHVPAQSANR